MKEDRYMHQKNISVLLEFAFNEDDKWHGQNENLNFIASLSHPSLAIERFHFWSVEDNERATKRN